MERNNAISAPQIPDVASLYGEWQRVRVGSRADFFQFLTTPTAERETFLASRMTIHHISGGVAAAVVTDNAR